MAKTIIRKASVKDLDDVLRLNFDLFKKEYAEFDKSLDLKWTFGPKGKSYFRKRISGKEGFCVVAENKGKMIGYLCGGLRAHSCRKKAVYAELENMLVDRKFRGKGIGTSLVKELLKWCNSKRAKYISVTASARNTSGIDFYRSLGFQDRDLTLEIIK